MRACTLLPLPPADPPNLPLVCCLLCVVQKRISLSLAGAIRNELTHTHTHSHTRLSYSHSHSRHSHTALACAHQPAPHTHTLRQAGRRDATTLTATATQQILSTTTTTAATPILIGRRRRQQKIRTISPNAAETHTAKNEWAAKVLHVQCAG